MILSMMLNSFYMMKEKSSMIRYFFICISSDRLGGCLKWIGFSDFMLLASHISEDEGT